MAFIKMNQGKKKISNPDDFNYNLNLLKKDIDSIYDKANFVDNKLYDYISRYNNGKIEDLKYIAKNLSRKIGALKMLSNNVGYSNALKIGFDSNFDINDNQDLYVDNKKIPSPIGSGYNMDISNSSLSMPSSSTANANVVDIISNSIFKGNQLNSINTYSIEYVDSKSTIALTIILDSPTDVNNIFIDSDSELPFNISLIDYYDIPTSGFKIAMNTPVTIVDKANVHFNKVNTSLLTVYLDMNNGKKSNYISDNMLQDYIDDPSLFSGLNQNISGAYYTVFNCNVKNIVVSHTSGAEYGAFVSRPIKMTNPSSIFINSDSILLNSSVEYYIYKEDYSRDNVLLSSPDLPTPINILNTTSVAKEGIIPQSAGSFSTPLFADAPTNSIPIYNVAKLSFSADKSSSFTLYENGVAVANPSQSIYYIDNNMVYFISSGLYNPASVYSIDYTPYYYTKDYIIPVNNPEQLSLLTQYAEYRSSTPVFLDPVTHIESISGDSYLKAVLNEEVDTSQPITVDKVVSIDADGSNIVYDTGLPLYTYGQNIFISGRYIYIKFDTTNYPALYNRKFEIKATAKSISVSNNETLYYGKDSSLVIKENLSNDYLYSKIYLMIIARKNSNVPPEVFINDVTIFSNSHIDYDSKTNTRPPQDKGIS